MFESFVRQCKNLGMTLEEAIEASRIPGMFKKTPPAYIIVLWWKTV